MKFPIYNLKERLNPQQAAKLQEQLDKQENVVQYYKALRKKYSSVKSNIKRIEKKLISIMNELPEKSSTPTNIEYNIERIENKYKSIDKAFKDYKYIQSLFNHALKELYFISPHPYNSDHYLTQMRDRTGSAELYLGIVENEIRITKRYFDNITSAFGWHAKSMAYLRYVEHKKRLEAAKNPPPQPDV